jgi:hypothetical protein
VPGLPTEIQIYRIGGNGAVSLGVTLNGGTQIVDLQTAPHPRGIYVVWNDAGSIPNTISAFRYDAESNIIIGPKSVQASGETSTGFAATAMGNQLAVVRHNADFSSSKEMLLTLFDESLSPIATGAFDGNDPVLGPTSALGSRDGRSLLVSFTTSPEQKFRTSIVRFDCEP